jgi:hypothetical protein
LLDIIGDEGGLADKIVFGDLSVLLGENMAVGVYGIFRWSVTIPDSRTCCHQSLARAGST